MLAERRGAGLYVPQGVSAGAPAPAILATNGFGGTKVDQASQLLPFLGGDRSIRAVDDATGAQVSVDFVMRDDPATFDPRVGMIGGSYGGQVHFATAGYEAMAGEPSRLDAIVPIITWNDLSYSLAPNNTALPPGDSVSSTNAGVTKYQWVFPDVRELRPAGVHGSG